MSFTKRFIYGVFLAVLVFVVLVTFAPLREHTLESNSSRANSYDEALGKFAILQQADQNDPIRPDCASVLMTHGRKTKRVYVLLHGLTNCPRQFVPFGEMLYEAGANVLIPRFPYHGFADRLTTELKNFRAEHITQTVDQAVDIANGLGEEVVIVGLSMSGAAAAWAAQMRPEVDEAVLLSPFLSIPGMPRVINSAIRNWANLMPNLALWWDPRKQDQLAGPEYAYAKFSTRAIGQSLRVADFAINRARQRKPDVKTIYSITSGADMAINHRRVNQLLELWRNHGAVVESIEIPAEENVPHDFIDPHQPGERTEEIYPRLKRWIEPDGGR